MDFDIHDNLTKASIILPALICLYTLNPLSIITKHVIMLYLYKKTFQDQRLLWLQHVVISMIARDYLFIASSSWVKLAWGCIVIAQYKIRVHRAIAAYLILLLCFDLNRALDLLLMLYISTKCPKFCENILAYLFLQRLFAA
jgi:hypothetical protein